MNLAVSDLLVGVGVMPFVALSIMNRGWVDFTVRQLCLKAYDHIIHTNVMCCSLLSDRSFACTWVTPPLCTVQPLY